MFIKVSAEAEQATKSFKITNSVKSYKEFESTARKSLDGVSTSYKQLTEAQQAQLKAYKDQARASLNLKAAQKAEALETAKLNIKKQELTKATKLEASLNLSTKNSIEEARLALRKLRAERDKLDLSTEEGINSLKRLNKEIDKNNEFIRENSDALTKQKINIGNYSSALEGLFPAFGRINSGLDKIIQNTNNLTQTDPSGFGKRFGSITPLVDGAKNSILAATKASLKFIATPIGAFITALAGIGFISKQFLDYNIEVNEARKLTQSLTGEVGDLAVEIRSNAIGISKSFNKEFNEVLRTSNTLVKQTGISFDEAFDIIQDGFLRGADSGGDYLDQLREYAPTLKEFGFTAQDVNELILTGQKEGFFNDKFLDSIKEAGVSLSEFTKAQSEALTNAFGEKFATSISKGINEGSITIKDALISIKEQSDEASLSVQEQAQLTADVFKGVGEDIGGAEKILNSLYESLGKAPEAYTRLQQEISENATLLREVEQAKADALDSESVLSFRAQWENMTLNIEKYWYKAISFISDIFNQWSMNTTAAIYGVVNVFKNIPTTIKGIADNVKQFFNNIVETSLKAGEAIGKALTFDFDGAKESFNEFKSLSKKTSDGLKEVFTDATKDVANNFSTAFNGVKKELQEVNKSQAEFKKNQDEINKRLEQGYNADPAIQNLKELEDQLTRLTQQQKTATTAESFKNYAEEIKKVQDKIDKIRGGSEKKSLNDSKKVGEARQKLAEFELEQKIKNLNAFIANEDNSNAQIIRAVNERTRVEMDLERIKSEFAINTNKLKGDALVLAEKELQAKLIDIVRQSNEEINKISQREETFKDIPDEEDPVPDSKDFLIGALVEAGEGTFEELQRLYDEDREAFLKLAEDKLSITEQFSQAQRDAISNVFSDFGQMYNIDAEKFLKLFEGKKLETQEYVEIAAEAVTGLYNSFQHNYQEDLDRLQANYEQSLQFAGEGTAARERLEKQFQEKQAEIRRKQAKQEKEQAIFRIIINTAQAITAALPNIPLSIAIGVLGAAQLAKVATAKVPEFKDGVRGFDGGWAILGDGGKNEFVTTPDGGVFKTPKTDTLYNLPKGTNVYKDERDFMSEGVRELTDINNIMFDPYLTNVKDVPNIQIDNGVSATEMDMILGKYFSNIKTHNTILDKKGIRTFLSSGNSITNNLNNRVSQRGIQV